MDRSAFEGMRDAMMDLPKTRSCMQVLSGT